jgi:hypothetical protein
VSEQSDAGAGRVCPVCGSESPARARYCWNCGARLSDQPGGFTQSLHDVVPEPPAAPVDGQAVAEESVATPDPDAAPAAAWPASVETWRATQDATPGIAPAPLAPVTPRDTEAPPEPPRKGVSRTVWIVLGILVGIALFCCVISGVLVVVASRDSAFQHQVSWYAWGAANVRGI